MNFKKFADLMEDIGFQKNESVTPSFSLNKNDLKGPVLKNAYPKVTGFYRVVSIWSQEGEVAFWAKENNSGNKLFPFHKEEVDFLARKNKFKKILKAKMVLHHDDPPCTARLITRKGGRWCPKCKLHPDMQSICFYFYCPSCDVPLKNLGCPRCGKTFERPD